ncbi:MAG: hypothetical protein ACW99A_03930 [Candidatus Kariarchaeaceae archaeon]
MNAPNGEITKILDLEFIASSERCVKSAQPSLSFFDEIYYYGGTI